MSGTRDARPHAGIGARGWNSDGPAMREGLPGRAPAAPGAAAAALGLASAAFGRGGSPRELGWVASAALESLADLAFALAMEPRAVGLGGSLSLLAVPAGAGGGYDAARRRLVVSPGGAGRMAACWGMALGHWVRSPPDRSPCPGDDEAAAWKRLGLTLVRADPDAAERASAAGARLRRMEADAAEAEAQRAAYLSRCPRGGETAGGAAYLADSARWISARRCALIPRARMDARACAGSDAAAGESAYAAEWRRYAAARGWPTPPRGAMVAGAVECAVSDGLAAAGASNPFLVEAGEDGMPGTGHPRPRGAERPRASRAVEAACRAASGRMAPARAASPERAGRGPGG